MISAAGLEKMCDGLDNVFGDPIGGKDRWQRRELELTAGGRQIELLS